MTIQITKSHNSSKGAAACWLRCLLQVRYNSGWVNFQGMSMQKTKRSPHTNQFNKQPSFTLNREITCQLPRKTLLFWSHAKVSRSRSTCWLFRYGKIRKMQLSKKIKMLGMQVYNVEEISKVPKKEWYNLETDYLYFHQVYRSGSGPKFTTQPVNTNNHCLQDHISYQYHSDSKRNYNGKESQTLTRRLRNRDFTQPTHSPNSSWSEAERHILTNRVYFFAYGKGSNRQPQSKSGPRRSCNAEEKR